MCLQNWLLLDDSITHRQGQKPLASQVATKEDVSWHLGQELFNIPTCSMTA